MSATEDACIKLLARLSESHPSMSGGEVMEEAVRRTRNDIQFFSSTSQRDLADVASRRLDWLQSHQRKVDKT